MSERPLIYSMGVSLDGFIAGPGGDIGWSAPGEELHRFHNEQARRVGVELYGRGMYETMRFWENVGERPQPSEEELDFAAIWEATRKIVFSRTLQEVSAGFELAAAGPLEVLAEQRQTPGGEIAVGGAGLARAFVEADAVDEYRPLVHPVVLGGGTPFLPPLPAPLELELAESRDFANGVTYLRYVRVRRP